jgi:hypothetical protein
VVLTRDNGALRLRGCVVIRTPDRRLRVFVSSIVGERSELAAERRVVERAIAALRLTPVMFELGARPYPPQRLYRAYLAQSDVFVGLYWQRYGRLSPGMQISGLEEEFQLAHGLPRLVYVKTPAPDREPRLTELLTCMKQEASESYRYFRTPAELGRLVRDDLATLLSERFAATRPPAAAAAPPPAPPPRSRRRGPSPLPVGTTSLVGRQQAIDEVAGLLNRPAVRLVTLTGPGGSARPAWRWPWPSGSATASVRALGVDLAGTDSPLQALVEQFGDERWLLVLDNLEQVREVAGRPGGAAGPLSRPGDPGHQPDGAGGAGRAGVPGGAAAAAGRPDRRGGSGAAGVAGGGAVRGPGRAVRPDFALTQSNAAAVVELCRRLEGLPLAIELAAARTRLLDPDALLRRLATSLDALGQGAVDLPERHRTLRATVQWSVGLLEDTERSLLETVAIFVDGWTVEAAAQVAELEEDRAPELSEALARHSLVYLDRTGLGPRLRMLETIRVYVAERLAARSDVAEIRRRHADYYRVLAERADRPLRGVGQGEWAERLEIEAGNLAAAMGWYLTNDREPLPHLFRVLCTFGMLRDHASEARSWIDQLLPTADALDAQARTELAWTAAAIANEVGDDPAALAAGERLAPLLDGIDDPFLRAVSRLAMAWIAPVVNDFDRALREASVSLEQLRDQDEPFWTALAEFTLGFLETAVGHYDDAIGHLTVGRDLGERLGNAWIAAGPRVQLGTVAVAQGRLEDARALLEEGLNFSLEARGTHGVTLCLAAFAGLALVEGDPERAAMLAGAAEGLRQRAGRRTWPSLRRGEAEVVAQVRGALGPSRFEVVFAAGSRLNLREAVAAVRDHHGGGATAP